MKALIIAAVFALPAGAALAQQLRPFGTQDRGGYTVQTTRVADLRNPEHRRRIHVSNAGAATDVCDPEHRWRVHRAATRRAADVHPPAINRGSSFNRQASGRMLPLARTRALSRFAGVPTELRAPVPAGLRIGSFR
jgi:hypothetical protein